MFRGDIISLYRHHKALILCALMVALSTSTLAAPIQTSQAQIYLSQFGYLPGSSANELVDLSTWSKAIEDFQEFAGITITGELDLETKETMSLPRCGVRDKYGSGSDSRSKRYATLGSQWPKKDLTYRISKYTNQLSRDQVDYEMKRAFNVWSGYTDLTFTEERFGPADIDIRFEERAHGDRHPFDGQGNTLAHAFSPYYGGAAHFDDEEIWTIVGYRGTNLFQVAAHEFGHSLGLSHSDVKTALMTPFFRGFDPNFELNSDDIMAIQSLYGRKTRRPIINVNDDHRQRNDLTYTIEYPDQIVDSLANLRNNRRRIPITTDIYYSKK